MKKVLYIMVASASLALAACSSSGKLPQKDLGLQLYSIRQLIGDANKFAANHDSILGMMAQQGYTFVETANYRDGKIYGMEPADFKAAVEKAGLKSLSTHTMRGLSREELAAGAPSEATMKWWDECIAAHKAAGMEYIVCPGHAIPDNLKDLKTWSEYHNAIGKKCAEAGVKYGFHNHSNEFTRKIEGKVVYDYLLENTNPEYVFFEMDVYWAVRGQVSPVEYFKRYPGRFKLLHIKDHKEIGQSGMVGFDAIFKHADIAGVEHIVVEIEAFESADMMVGIGKCASYLLEADFVKDSYKK